MGQATSEEAISVRARWIVTLNGPPIQGGCIVIRQGHVVSILREAPAKSIDLGDFAILPGFVNSHTHLEFSDLSKPIQPMSGFASWIVQVIQHRRLQQENQSSEEYLKVRSRNYRLGLSESSAFGAGFVVDNVTEPWDPNWCISPQQQFGSEPTANLKQEFKSTNNDRHLFEQQLNSPDVLAVTELLGVTSARLQDSMGILDSRAHSEIDTLTLRMGLAPHAPYTTPWSLVERSVEHSRSSGCLVSMHLAESTDEINWINNRTGPIADMLARFPLEPSLIEPNHSLSDYIRLLGRASKAFVVHGNYLDDDSMEQLQLLRNHVAVVYCPRTHSLFGHEPHPVERLLARGVSVFLGTDSRASNPDLSILQEARLAYRLFPNIDARRWLEMITSQPAGFLGVSQRCGQIVVGGLGRFSVVPCDTSLHGDVFDEILSAESHPRSLCF